MLHYWPEHIQLLEQTNEQRVKYRQLPSGGILTYEEVDSDSIRILGICSTDLNDYLSADLAPGNICNANRIK